MMNLKKVEEGELDFSKNKNVNIYKNNKITVGLNKVKKNINISMNEAYLECDYSKVKRWIPTYKKPNSVMLPESEYNIIYSEIKTEYVELFSEVKKEIMKIEKVESLEDIK